MMTYFLKLTVCLFALYGFYHFFLRHQKILLFNRFYLIISLVFSLIIPLIVIPVKSNFTLNNTIDTFTLTTGQLVQGEAIVGKSSTIFTFQYVLTVLFIIISSFLLIRFAINIFRILSKALTCKKVKSLRTSIVLVEEKTLPYSFFKYVFINRSEFENGKIEKELLIHEEAHCLQYHSIDIIILELLNVFLWFNPALWLFRKAILLNHEYIADNKVLTSSNPIYYQQLLVNLVFQNNTNYLVSNFKYSSIKNRLIMMTQSGPSNNAIIRKIAVISLTLFLGIALTFSQENALTSNVSNFDNGWWKPVFQKHNIDMKRPNFKNTFNVGNNDAKKQIWFEMGTTDSLNKKIVTFKDATVISKEANDTYWIITSGLVIHDLEKNLIEWKKGKMESFSFKSENTNPILSASFEKLEFDANANIMKVIKIYTPPNK